MLGLALGLLVAEGELRKILKSVQVAGLDAGVVEGALVPHGVVVCVLKHRLQAVELKLLKLGTRHALNFGVVVLLVVGDVLFRHWFVLLIQFAAYRFPARPPGSARRRLMGNIGQLVCHALVRK